MYLLPFNKEIETKEVLKKVSLAERYLGELKGVINLIPNEQILLSTLPLQEAKASSEIESIITTHDELYKQELNLISNINAKEVQNYKTALIEGYKIVKEKGVLINNDIIKLHSILENNNAGFRTQHGTTLKDNKGIVIYTPLQDAEEISSLMSNLEKFINDNEISDLNPLVKMAIIHHRFETIHPFYDGNGRMGRIINILYLQLQGLLNKPVLYLSRYIIDNKQDYYRLLQEVRDKENWDEWIIYMLDGIIETSQQTIKLINKIRGLMFEYKKNIRERFPQIYSQELINNLFKHPYTKIEYLENDIGVKRITATKYLGILVENNFLRKEKRGRDNYYLNDRLIELLVNVREL